MYDKLYTVWKKESENKELAALSPDFYRDVAEYLKRLKEESRMVEKKAAKANLLHIEIQNVENMIVSMLDIRCEKLSRHVSDGEQIPAGALAQEEQRVLSNLISARQACADIVTAILKGSVRSASSSGKQEKEVLRFLKNLPAIIGSDLEPYGPFKAEEVGSLPQDNAKVLIDQGIVKKVEET